VIDIISGRDLGRLAETQARHLVSIYLPTHRSGDQTAQDPIRLKNLLARAVRELETLGLRTVEANEMLSSVGKLRSDAQFWAHLEEGLAVFVSENDTHIYRLPDSVDELVVVAERFHVKPLLPLVTRGRVFHVLVLGQNDVRLLRGSRFGMSEVGLGEIPRSMAEVLKFDDREAQLQSHASGRVGTGQVTATFHGQGVDKDTREVDLDRFLSAVDAAVCQLVAGTPAPLVLAGVASTVARYRRLTKHPELIETVVEGNAELLSPAELHHRAWPLVDEVFHADHRRARDAVLGGSVPTADSLADSVVAAYNGHVASLFVPLGVHRWGSFDVDRQEVDEHEEHRPGDRDLLDAAAVETLSNGGAVFAVDESDIPGGGLVAATLRF